MENLSLALKQGLTEQEYQSIVTHLGREPNASEIGIFSAMWSEHCSYKSSRVHLKRFPTKGERVIEGPGENAGIVDIGDGLCVAFKMESHNHPSYIEPFQGAATGVGGILRDIFTMGARPIALLDSLRFGNPSLPKTKYLVNGIVSGISFYGNCIGIPTVGGETYFEDCYNGNPLVNVFALGIAQTSSIFRAYAKGINNTVMYIGSKTGRDGIHGAVMASETFNAESEEKRPAVQVGDPFTEKLLMEACLELFKTGVVVGIQDMGAAGLTSSSTEMASKAGTGLRLNLDNIPTRETKMTPYEIMLSESQERMLLVVEQGKEEVVNNIFRKWNLDYSVIGKVTDSKKLTLEENGKTVVDIPIDIITDLSPAYNRPISQPKYLENISNIRSSDYPSPNDIGTTLLNILSSPNISSKRSIYEQYDYMVRTNTLVAPGSDAAVVRIKGTNKALAMTTNCNSRYCYLDPYVGGMIAVAESARNLACAGAVPLAITDCLNFGNPENPEIMWQFSQAIDGISKAVEALNTPVVSGNVSFYNQTEDEAVFPTPTVGMVGLIEDYSKTLTQWFRNEGDLIILVGDTLDELGGTEYLKVVHGVIDGKPPAIDLQKEYNLIQLLLEANNLGIINSAHDISEGGLGVALSECCFNPKGLIGMNIESSDMVQAQRFLFSESQSRAVITIDKTHFNFFKELSDKHKTPARALGSVGGDKFYAKGLVDIPINEAYDAWANGFDNLMRSND